MEERMKIYCPICKEEKEFIRIVEAHIETEPFTMHTPMGGSRRQWVDKTDQPTAYCSNCNIVLYVGPSADEVEKTFREQEKERKRRKEKRLQESFRRQLESPIRPKL